MLKNKGTSLQEYAIILGLLLVVLIPIWLTVGQSIVVAFQEYSNIFSSNPENTPNINIITPEVNYDFTNTGSTSSCENGLCDINLGDYVLTGIPDNISELVETSGVSGATDALMPLLDQLTKQLEEQGLTEESQTLKDMANIGYFLADINEYLENEVDYCLTQSDPEMCFTNFGEEVPSIKTPDNVQHVLADCDYSDNFKLIDGSTYFDGAYKNPDSIEKYKTKDPATAFISKYYEIKDNPKYPESVKAFIESIYIQIYKLNNESSFLYWSFYMTETNFFDPITGEEINSAPVEKTSILDLDNLTTSVSTNFGSTLICEVGENIAENEECKDDNDL